MACPTTFAQDISQSETVSGPLLLCDANPGLDHRIPHTSVAQRQDMGATEGKISSMVKTGAPFEVHNANGIRDEGSDCSQTSDGTDDSDGTCEDEEASVEVRASQLEGKIMDFTDTRGHKRKLRLVKALGWSTAGVFRVEEILQGTETIKQQKGMVLKIPVIEMASGVTAEYRFVFTHRLRKQLQVFIEEGEMKAWLKRAGESVSAALIPEEVREELRCSPPSRYELLDVLLSYTDRVDNMEEIRRVCVQRGLVNARDFSDLGKAIMSWATVCLLNPLHEETIDRCLSRYKSDHNTAMPACLAMLSQNEWPSIAGVNLYNCRLMEEMPGMALYGLVKRVSLAMWTRESLHDLDKPFMPSTKMDSARMTRAAVELAYQLDRAGFVQADDRQNFRVVKNQRDGTFDYLVCIDGASIRPISGHTIATEQVLQETQSTISRYNVASDVLTDVSMSLLRFWTQPLATGMAFSTEGRLLRAVKTIEPRRLGYSRELHSNLKLGVFATFENEPTTLRYWTMMQAALRHSRSVYFPRHVRKVAEAKMLQFGTASDLWFEAAIRDIYETHTTDMEMTLVSVQALSLVVGEHAEEIESLEEDVEARRLAISVSCAMKFGLFEGVGDIVHCPAISQPFFHT